MAGMSTSIVVQPDPSKWISNFSNQLAVRASEDFTQSFTTVMDIIRIRFDRPIIDMADYTTAYGNMENSIEGAADAQQNLSESAGNGTEEAKKQASAWSKAVDAFNKVKGVAEKAKGVMEVFLKPAAEQQKWEDMFKARSGDDQVGAAMFDKFKQKALGSGQDFNKSMEGVLTLYPQTQNTDQLDKLMDFSATLSAMSPKGKGINEASSAIAEAFKGDTKELAAQMQVKKEDLSGLESVAKTQNMEAFLSTLGNIMTTAGMTSTALQTMMDSPVNQWQALLGNYKNSLATIGEGALQGLLPVLTMLNDAFTSGTFYPIIEGLSIGLTLLAQGFTEVAQGALWLWGVLSGTLPVILPILLGVVAGVVAYRIAMLGAALVTNMMAVATKISAVAQGIFNAVLKANPVALIISLVVGFIIVLLGLIAALQPVREAIAAFFRWLGEISAAVVGWCIDMFTGLINTIIDLINLILSGVNTVVNAVGDILGIESTISLQLEKVDSEPMKEFVQKGILDFHDSAAEGIENFSMQNLKNEIGIGGTKAGDQEALLNEWNTEHPGDTFIYPKNPNTPAVPASATATNPLYSPNFTTNQGFAAANNMNTINRVNEVGSVNETVDISSEDLTMLRELAEIQAIQNFVELTPTVQVTTGNINNAGDIDSIISKINQKLNEEFVATAQGVYT